MSAGERAPDPQGARTPGEFLALLQELKEWSGLTYRELSVRAEAAGDVLPRSTVANMLGRVAGLPREELLTAFVRACGTPPGERDAWLTVRKELAAGGTRSVPAETGDREPGAGPSEDEAETEAEAEASSPAQPDPAPADRTASSPLTPARRSRAPRLLVGLVAVTALVLAVISVVTLVRDGVQRVVGQPVTPGAGQVLIRSLESGLCLGERAGDRSGQVYQRECAGADVPRYELLPLTGADSGHWRLVTHHPEFGPGCSGVPGASVKAAAPLHDSECGERGRTETFRLEPYGTPVQGYRIRPGDSALCVTVTGDLRAPWSRLETAACADDARGRRGQLFSFDRRK
ncbi:helix-turn-helix domain-containing protein [Streptomyces sp. NPDC048604]|uniref:helix-turn-helix domain-containing protein n=1 Tax=Streptomyces sp. NPDC048604 TaxID=3365578 RepID=UPI00371C75DC